jgi:hypothetical protein
VFGETQEQRCADKLVVDKVIKGSNRFHGICEDGEKNPCNPHSQRKKG